MEKEISSGTMLGIVLIALAAVIGLGFAVFSIAKGVANEGTIGVQDNLNVVSESTYEDYNDKVVTGTQVKSALMNFQGKSIAILINTTAMNKGVTSYAARTSGPVVYNLDDVPYVNYNALLAVSSDGGALNAIDPLGIKDSVIKSDGKGAGRPLRLSDNVLASMSDGIVTVSQAFAIDDSGKVLFDNGTGGLNKSGNCEYVANGSKFTANLIRDTSGTNIGILFTQMAK